MVFVALSHCYLSDRGNVLALSPINPSPRGRWTHDTRESLEFVERCSCNELAETFLDFL